MQFNQIVLIVFGLALIGGAVAMPADGVREQQVCVGDREPPDMGENCPTVGEQRYVENDSSMPLLVGGGVCLVVGLFLDME